MGAWQKDFGATGSRRAPPGRRCQSARHKREARETCGIVLLDCEVGLLATSSEERRH